MGWTGQAVNIDIPDDVRLFLGGDAKRFVVSAVAKELAKVSREAAQHVLDVNEPRLVWGEPVFAGGLAER